MLAMTPHHPTPARYKGHTMAMKTVIVEVLEPEPTVEENIQQTASRLAVCLENKFRAVTDRAKALAGKPSRNGDFNFTCGMALTLGIATRLMYALAANDRELLEKILKDADNQTANTGEREK